MRLTRPGLLLRLEGAAVFALALWLYARSGGPWLLFAALLLAPNLSMLGYLAGGRRGAAVYNAARVLGYGFKYPTAFKDTHLQRL